MRSSRSLADSSREGNWVARSYRCVRRTHAGSPEGMCDVFRAEHGGLQRDHGGGHRIAELSFRRTLNQAGCGMNGVRL